MNLSIVLNHRRRVSIPLPICGIPTYIPPWALLLNSHCHHQPSSICSTSVPHPSLSFGTYLPWVQMSSTKSWCPLCLQQLPELGLEADVLPKPKGWISVRGGLWTSLPVLCLPASPAVCEKSAQTGHSTHPACAQGQGCQGIIRCSCGSAEKPGF